MTQPQTTPRVSRVFVVQEPFHRVRGEVVSRIPLHTLEEFGPITFLCSWGELRDDGDGDMPASRASELYHKMRAKLRDFCNDDFLVLLGNPALGAMATLIAGECNNGRVSILDWVRDARAYRIIDIDAHCQPGGLARARPRR